MIDENDRKKDKALADIKFNGKDIPAVVIPSNGILKKM